MISGLRGMPDIFPEELKKRDHFIKIFSETATLHGFHHIETPIVEPLEVFMSSVGESSDIISKEMYTLVDKGNRQLCLRPENTAGIIRAILSNKKQHEENQKYHYCGPMFRYERPQKGRLRQFNQLGIENVNAESPIADVESILVAMDFIDKIGIKKYALELNTLGDDESRSNHRKALVQFFADHDSQLSMESKVRLQKNPLRIFDSKDPGDQETCRQAPLLKDYLTPSAQSFFNTIVDLLQKLKVPFTLNPYMVRGLDYYCHTIFEFKSDDLGAQSTFLAGGRYDKLSAFLGGKPLPSVGWASGLERLMLIGHNIPPTQKSCIVIPGDETLVAPALMLAHKIRSENLSAELTTSSSFKAGLKQASKKGATFAVLVGHQEIETETVTWKNLTNGTQQTDTFAAFMEKVKNENN